MGETVRCAFSHRRRGLSELICREDCSQAAVHAPWVAGIAGGKLDGAFSIALSGGYEDDEDSGYTLYVVVIN